MTDDDPIEAMVDQVNALLKKYPDGDVPTDEEIRLSYQFLRNLSERFLMVEALAARADGRVDSLRDDLLFSLRLMRHTGGLT